MESTGETWLLHEELGKSDPLLVWPEEGLRDGDGPHSGWRSRWAEIGMPDPAAVIPFLFPAPFHCLGGPDGVGPRVSYGPSTGPGLQKPFFPPLKNEGEYAS